MIEHDTAAATRQERSDASRNRQHILDTAKHLFAEQGVAETNMKQIALAAGVGKGTLYRHFAHKGELCAALLHEDVEAFKQRIGPIVDEQHELLPLTRLEFLLVERIKLTESHLPLFAALDDAGAAARPARPVRGSFSAWTHTHIVALLAEAIDAGEIVPLDIQYTADAILEAVLPPLFSYQRNNCGYSVERIIEGMRRLFIDGLRRG